MVSRDAQNPHGDGTRGDPPLMGRGFPGLAGIGAGTGLIFFPRFGDGAGTGIVLPAPFFPDYVYIIYVGFLSLYLLILNLSLQSF